MKAAAFEYVRAHDLAHALQLLEAYGADAKPIAGGQSLVPMMAMRLARPALLIDINRLHELGGVGRFAERVSLGAAARQCDVERDVSLHAALPLVRDALRWVGHSQTRNRGTIGGSLVHADPSAELPLAAVILDCTLSLRSQAGERRVAARDFFTGPMSTSLRDTECLVAMDWPVWQGSNVVTAFDEVAMRHGDFAMASAACQLQLDGDGVCLRAAIGVGGLDGMPRAFPELAASMVGHRIDRDLAASIAAAAVAQTEPGSDLHASGDYRRHLGRVLLERVLLQAAEPARLAA